MFWMIKHFEIYMLQQNLKQHRKKHSGVSRPKRVYYIINKSKYGINCFDIDINGGIECDTQHIFRDEIQHIDIQKGIFIHSRAHIRLIRLYCEAKFTSTHALPLPYFYKILLAPLLLYFYRHHHDHRDGCLCLLRSYHTLNEQK